MPKDYSKSKIYKMEAICESEEGDVYIGSTTQNYISHRLAEHVRNYKSWKKGKQNFTSSFSLFEKYGIDNVRIVLLETYPCHNNDELRSRETHYQKQNKCVNKFIAFRSEVDHLEYRKQYREEHHDKILEYQKQYRIEHNEEISEYKKKYREEHRDELLKQMKQYREEHKQEISEKAKEIITCECGRPVRKYDLKRHQRSDIHKELMTKIV